MTENHEDQDLQRRLEQARAELTGHVPLADQRLEAMFLTGHAPAEPPSDIPTEVVPIEPHPGRRRRWAAVTAIAAAFVLLVGGVVYAAGRGDSPSPVEVAGETAGVTDATDSTDASPQAVLADESPDTSESDGTSDGTDDLDSSDDSDSAEANGDRDSHHDGDGPGFLPDELREHFESLWAENREWLECARTTIDEFLQDDSDSGTRALPDLETACGEPSFDSLDGFGPDSFGLGDFQFDFVPFWSEEFGEFDFDQFDFGELDLDQFDFDRFDFDQFDFGELDFDQFDFGELGDLCERVETESGVSVTCEWPGEFGFDQLFPDGFEHDFDQLFPDGFEHDFDRLFPDGFEGFEGFDEIFPDGLEGFDLDGSLDELRRRLDEVLPDGWLERFERWDGPFSTDTDQGSSDTEA